MALSGSTTSPDQATAAVLVVMGDCANALHQAGLLRQAVGTVVVIDNNEQAAVTSPEEAVAVQVLHHGNRGGLAGGYNRALGWLLDYAPQVRQVVFVDQDSDPSVLGRFLRAPDVQQLLAQAGTAAVAPAYRERATGLRGRPIELHRWRAVHLPRDFTGLRQVAFVINSMSVWRMEALRRIGPFNEALAVDHVDTDQCLRARALGLAIWNHGDHVFDHAIGERRSYRLLGRELQATGHGPARRRMIGRNTVWLGLTWWWREPAFAGLCALRLAYEAVGILVAEDHRAARLLALLRGSIEGVVMRVRGR